MKQRPPRLMKPEAMCVFLAVGLNKEDINDFVSKLTLIM
jgi:hypothetical protein